MFMKSLFQEENWKRTGTKNAKNLNKAAFCGIRLHYIPFSRKIWTVEARQYFLQVTSKFSSTNVVQ